MRLFTTTLALIVLILQGCSTLNFSPYKYEVALVEVERPSDSADRYSPPITTTQAEDGAAKYVYADSLISTVWLVGSTQIYFDLENLSDQSMRLVWDEAAFVGPDGQTDRVMHEGVRYIDRSNSQPPSLIARRGRISDFLVPTDNVSYVEGRYGGWRTRALLSPGLRNQGTVEEAQANVGQRFSVILPLEVQGTTNEYTFTFEVRAVSSE